ncbi:hypothetical protein K457DRAFT_157403 [Linnemannia elongata AG-77]|uniref:protein-tyrosine-phosphatase n=1 Tax=Linnemannia elongata AG-77 TaxID=1314771 RepID=A0A197JQJ1_9FUNG|nr:hypothetical protein K457DRAFT_157403 [Linnemannia elongata AG-77]
MNASSPAFSHTSMDQQQQLFKTQTATDPRIAALASNPNDPPTLVLLDPATPPTQSAAAAGASLSTSSNIATATATARPSLSFAGSGFFAATQDPARHLQQQLPLETPFFTPQAVWTESARSDYFSTAASTPAPMPTHLTSPLSATHRSQANLFANSFNVPAQTPAAVDISSFSASSPSYFPSPTDPSSTALDQDGQAGFQLSMPSTSHSRPTSMGGALNGSWEPYPSSRSSSMSGSSYSIPSHNRPNMSISMPLSSLMSPPSSTSSPSRPTMSSLSQSHHSPVAPAAPAELNLKEMTSETVSQLLEKVMMTNGGDKNAVMLLDMRSSVSYAASSIQTAVSVCVPNMLLKRPKTSLQQVTEQLTTEQDIETFSKWKQFANIVLFDASGAVPVVGSPTILMVQKFRKEGCNANLAYLTGGFNDFMVRYNNLCRTEAKPASPGSNTDVGSVPPRMSLSGSGPFSAPASTNPMSTVSPPRQRLHLGSLPSMMTQAAAGPLGCQTPMIENPNVNPLFESVRQAMGLSTNITEEIPVRLPMGFSFDTMREHLPKWLLSAITDGSGKARLAEYFQKVEINENKRLALLMLPQNMRSGRTTNFSIGAGIEQGLKNRYNNIWPYDHSRVKLTEIDAGHDDYINASFLTPPLSRKSYIATQGPLPSTFQDFWKTAWEQNSRVVVMLTREQEMGRIKCHQYWPSSQHPLMEVGSMRVSFVNEFLPDPTIGTILVRQMKLQHIHRPDEPARSITQIQYTGWPDFGVPETPLEVLRVIQLANEHNVPASAGPMIVHCSAGCGRTGAFCVIDSILTELHEHPEVVLQQSGATAAAGKRLSLSNRPSLEFSRSGNDRVVSAMSSSRSLLPGSSGIAPSGGGGGAVAGTGTGPATDDPMADIVYASVSTFREQRISMVQTLRQYVFCYEAIYWHLALEFTKERPDLGLMVTPPPSLAVHTPLLPMPPNTMTSNPALSMGNAPITTTSEEFSFFG